MISLSSYPFSLVDYLACFRREPYDETRVFLCGSGVDSYDVSYIFYQLFEFYVRLENIIGLWLGYALEVDLGYEGGSVRDVFGRGCTCCCY